MSTVTRKALTAEQLVSNRNAIHGYIAQHLQGAGSYGKVIVIPEFIMDDKGVWSPVEDSVIRAANNPKDPSAAFIRLGTKVLGDGLKEQYRFTNTFQDTNALSNLLLTLGVGAGDVVPGKLVVEESLVPFSASNPARDIKWADQAAGIACKVEDKPIYRRIAHTTKMDKEDINITHTNRAELSANALMRFNGGKANSTAMNNAGMSALNTPVTGGGTMTAEQIEARIDELEKIPVADRTRAQKKELKDLEALLPA